MPKKAVIYARYSSSAQRDESIDGQIRACRDYAKRENISVIEEYIDRAKTGRTDARPDYQRLLRDLPKKRFDVILVWKHDRISRDRYDKALFRAKIKKHNISVISVTELIPDTPEGIILESVLDGMAEYYSANLAQNTLRGMRENALQARYNGGAVPIGYMIDENKRYQIDPQQAPIIKRIFRLYLDGTTMQEITVTLRKEGIRHKGKPIGKGTIENILSRPIYKGTYQFMDITIEGAIPAIVDKKTYEEAQIRRAQRARGRKAMPDTPYLLTGKIQCGKCGSAIVGDSGTSQNGETHRYYCCNGRKKKATDCNLKSARKEDIEEFVLAAAHQIVMDDELIKTIAGRVVTILDEELTGNPKLKIIEKTIKNIKRKIDNLTRSLEDFPNGSAAVSGRIAELEIELIELEAEKESELLGHPDLDPEDIIYWLSQFKDPKGDPVLAQQMIDTFINQVVLDDDSITIIFNFSAKEDKVKFEKKNDLIYINEEHTRPIKFGCAQTGSPCWARTNDSAVNSRMLYLLS